MPIPVSRSVFLLTFTLLATGLEDSVAQKTNSAASFSQPSDRIFLGQQVDDSLQVLRKRQIAFDEGGMAISQDENSSYYSFTLDLDHTRVCFFYSKSSREVSKISMIFFPHRKNQVKSVQAWIDAKEVAIQPDGAYIVHFSKPATYEETLAREAVARAGSESLFAEDSLKASDVRTTNVLGLDVPIVEAGELERYVGNVVAVVGVPGRSKIVRLSNIEFQCPDRLRGQRVIAAGILGRCEVTEQQVAEMNRKGVAHDGPGVKYRLYSNLQGDLAEATPFAPK